MNKSKGKLMQSEELLTTEQAVTYLKISKRTLFRLIQEGKIRALRVGNAYRFKKTELDNDIRVDTEEARAATR
jgi:excisionase family DNA binding protein